jgi:hypothetical protein
MFNNLIINSDLFKKFVLLALVKNPPTCSLQHRTTFKSLFSINNSLESILDNKKSNSKFSNQDSVLTKTLFDCFLHINTLLPTNKIEPHHSFSTFYIYNSSSNVGHFNLRKIFILWNNIIIFISNIFFYNIKFVAFGNSYFRNEVFALNGKILSFLKTSWRYTNSFIFFFRNKTTRYNKIYFNYLTQLNFRIAFIIDVYYCNRTIYYCNLFKLLTIGPVPVSSNFYTLSVTLPSSSNLTFSNYFFIRLMLKIKKHSHQQAFSQLSLNYHKIL